MSRGHVVDIEYDRGPFVAKTRAHTILIGLTTGPLEIAVAAPAQRSAGCSILGRVPGFAVSICVLTLFQALTVAAPQAIEIPALARLRSGWWAAIPTLSVVAFVFGVRALSGAADGLTYLALIAVPPLAALALAGGVRGARPWFMPAAAALFALAWADRHGLAGQTAGLLLEALSCVTLAVALAAVTPRGLLKLGIVVAAAADTWLVASNLLTAPNNALNAAAPVAQLPHLQSAVFGSAVMGYEDLFVAALLGALLAAQSRLAARGAAIAAAVGLLMNLLFFAVKELPATVPIAVTLLILEVSALLRARRSAPV